MLITLFSPFTIPRVVQSFLPGNLEWRKETAGKKVYLTFDDGPVPGLTEDILSILSGHDARATFFCVGENVARHPDVYEKITAAGHTTGNHTYRHLKGWDVSTGEYLADIEKASKLIKSELFRPPYGRITRDQAREVGKHYRIIMWSLLSYDFRTEADPGKNLDIIRRKTKPGSIVVFHDNRKARENVLYMLPKYLEYLRDEGYEMEGMNN